MKNEQSITEELINNKFELAEWIHKDVMKRINNELKSEREILLSLKNRLIKQHEEFSGTLKSINAYVSHLKKYEKEIKKAQTVLTDRNNNLQNIYDKMIEIEKRLNSGEWPGVLPPLELDLD